MRATSGSCLRGLRRLAPTTLSMTTTTTRPSLTRQPLSAAQLRLCRYSSSPSSPTSTSSKSPAQQPPPPPLVPQAIIDVRHIRENAELHADNCARRNYGSMSGSPARILELFGKWYALQKEARTLREEANIVRKQMVNAPGAHEDIKDADGPEKKDSQSSLLERARALKQQLATIKSDETSLTAEMQRLAAALPNLTSDETPDDEQTVLGYFNCDGEEAEGRPRNNGASGSNNIYSRGATSLANPAHWRSHVYIGSELGILDFSAASAASGWGWYYLLGDGARLEQALVQYALNVAHRHGWQLVSPPSIVRSGISAACGFQPRDQGGEQQTYSLEGLPLSLTATAEIPLAALYADTTIEMTSSGDRATGSPPIRRAAVSRCYRAEAGARGASTKGLYRVHEFTKVELFAWTDPRLEAATETFDELVDVQTEILLSLGLPCRVLEMPASDLGASAYRKIDIETFFPGRCRPRSGHNVEGGVGNSPADFDYSTGWGEVTSASICTDYQSRRLATRARIDGGPLTFPWTLNGTALAVPRVLAAILENGWDEETKTVAIPECLQPWMDGQEKIVSKQQLS